MQLGIFFRALVVPPETEIDVAHVARLARLHLTTEETKRWIGGGGRGG